MVTLAGIAAVSGCTRDEGDATAPPELCSYDPVADSESALCTVVPDVYAADISTDGCSLLVQSFTYVTTNGARAVQSVTWVVDVRNGSRRELAPGWYHPAWAGTGRFLKLEPLPGGKLAYELLDERGEIAGQGALPHVYNLTLSPDGTRVAGVALGDPDEDWLGPGHLVVVDLRSGERRRFDDTVTVWMPANDEFGLRGGPAWSPDGSRIALIGVVKDGGSEIQVVNLDTGQVEETVALPGLERGSYHPLTWSPDGHWWTAGEFVLSTQAGHHVCDIRLDAPGTPDWDPSGTWFALGYGGWGWVRFYRIAALHGPVHEKTIEDVVFPVGWDATGRFYFIRWVDWEQRIVPDWD